MATLGAPKHISPLIRFGRYAALLTGIVYGSMHHKSLMKKEVVIQEHEDKLRAARDARLKAEKERFSAEEMAALGKEAGVVQH